MTIETLSEQKCFGGIQGVYRHQSSSTGTDMEFAVFQPAEAAKKPLPVLVFLSGLTCTWENFTTKAGAQRYAAEHGVIVVAPDTSPRGEGVADDQAYDLGKGAGFYLNATEDPWAKHYRMEDYVVKELPAVLANNFPVDLDRMGITGHSMGGHGALTLAIKNPDLFKTLSAFAPIVSPANCPWGQKAFNNYLGDNIATWGQNDASALVETFGWSGDILIDQGASDTFLETELLPDVFVRACERKSVALTLRMQEGYDHSYYFIASFIEDHIAWHAKRLKA
ncbi:S-formylglutathione hydrolase [Aestuariispira insulae]|uniref:S-formylglutathione hydrolase n=1 Tax=Aestuariispira insulae TaxID=1461337 RepID=A0A3D9HI44_9PROT|nr:S-formylglutathione hydrolase [Aestuariispira insulae]RED49150.1 S-formylglutathione hydrolase [Aestuariispira insulae]